MAKIPSFGNLQLKGNESKLFNSGVSGVDVNNSQTVVSTQRTLQKNINDDVFTTMYNAAKEARQMRLNSNLARYNAAQLKKGFFLKSIGTWANNAANAVSSSSILGGGAK